MRHGKIRKHINILVALIAGAVSHLMKREEFYLHQPVLLLMIFMGVNEKGKISLPIVYLPWMLKPGNANGIFNLYIMIYGIGICPHRPYWLQLKKTERR